MKWCYFSLFHSHTRFSISLGGAPSHAVSILSYTEKSYQKSCKCWLQGALLTSIQYNRVMPLPALFIYYSLIEVHKNVLIEMSIIFFQNILNNLFNSIAMKKLFLSDCFLCTIIYGFFRLIYTKFRLILKICGHTNYSKIFLIPFFFEH